MPVTAGSLGQKRMTDLWVQRPIWKAPGHVNWPVQAGASDILTACSSPHPWWSKGAKSDDSLGCKPVKPCLLSRLRLLLRVQAVWPSSSAGEPRSCYPILKERE